MIPEETKAAADAARITQINEGPKPDQDGAAIPVESETLRGKFPSGVVAGGQEEAALKATDPATVKKEIELEAVMQRNGIAGDAKKLIAELGGPEAAMKVISEATSSNPEARQHAAALGVVATATQEADKSVAEKKDAPGAKGTEPATEKEKKEYEAKHPDYNGEKARAAINTPSPAASNKALEGKIAAPPSVVRPALAGPT